MSIKINNENYESYKKVLEIVWRNLYKNLDPDLQKALSGSSPVDITKKWENKIPKSQLYSGLRQALADSVVILNDSPALAADVDADLIANNLPNVRTLKGLVSDSVNKVIKRQKIKNIDEYYIIKEMIDDTVSDISHENRNLLTKLLGDFERQTTTR